ncbi:hypothetical protein M3A74_03240 [Corynebacterium appendicis]|uniref:hypothetical protein n=1 Tax=Corynebacterium appendicis TaxID=163202 RepID=UPI00223ABF1F|nr:hypothetical protein [Corynebacterium appendicis]MCT1683828.1 hypothetical protein [Corynebacterium appendicis]
MRFALVPLDGSAEATREWTTWAQFWASSSMFADVKEATAVAYTSGVALSQALFYDMWVAEA